MIQIFTDTSANLPAAYIQKYSLRVIPLHYSIDGGAGTAGSNRGL